jgi:hypothetical protein
VFSEGERSGLRDQLVTAARADEQIDAAAVVGSGARDREDEWSDIDLALRLAADFSPEDVMGRWTARMYEAHGAVAHLDIWSGPTLFRVFLLASSLQVDLSFWPSDVFAASGGSFRLLFGHANEPAPSPVRVPDTLIGMGWLYALHARSSIARGRVLQALYMINGIRDQVVALACLRHNLPPDQGRGVDDLPDDVKQMIADTVARGLGQTELHRSFAVLTSALLIEADHIDPSQASRLEAPVRELVRTAAAQPDTDLSQ